MAAPRFGRRQKDPNDPDSKRKLTGSSLKQAVFIFKYLRPYRGLYFLGMFFLVLSTLSSLAFPFFLGELVNSATGGETLKFLQELDQAALILAAIIGGQTLFSFFRVYTFAIVTENAMADVRRQLFQKLIVLPLHFFEKRRVGELTSRITADVGQLQTMLSTTLAEFFRQIATLVIGTAVLLFVSPRLTLYMIMVFPPVVIVAAIFGRFIRKLSKSTQDELANTNIVVEESLQNISVVKAFTNELLEIGRYAKSLKLVVRHAIKTSVYRAAFISFLIFALFGTILFVIWLGAGMVEDKIIEIGDLITFILYTIFIGGSITGLGDMYGQVQKTVGATERIREILEEDSELNPDKAEGLAPEKIEGRIEYKSVGFEYPTRTDVEVLKNINFVVEPGKKVALAGSSGAGKSTIVQLLMRLYDNFSGSILVDGKELHEYDMHGLRKHIGIVPQEVILFGGTIGENISYGRTSATEEEIIEAAKKANAWQFIQDFPEGLDTVVGERGVKLSGGQRQRIAIARAILKDPAILILDEATSSLDAGSERLVQDALDVLMEGRTTLIIAHRLATIRDVDRIFVLDKGEIVESGTHQELVEMENGFYQNLVKLQMEEKS